MAHFMLRVKSNQYGIQVKTEKQSSKKNAVPMHNMIFGGYNGVVVLQRW
jgi:hypothetical protein